MKVTRTVLQSQGMVYPERDPDELVGVLYRRPKRVYPTRYSLVPVSVFQKLLSRSLQYECCCRITSPFLMCFRTYCPPPLVTGRTSTR